MPGVDSALQRLGGVSTWAELTAHSSPTEVRKALAAGAIVKDRRGRYVAVSTSEHYRLAHELSAVLSHESAAVHHGWKVRSSPDAAVITVRRKRRLSASDQARSTPHYRDLAADDIHRGVTKPLQTVLDCARDLPRDRALTVADSALRSGEVTIEDVRRRTAALRGRGAGRARWVGRHGSYVAANPMESVLRVIALEVPGFNFVPQLRVWDHGLYATVDLGDEALRVALEAEGYAFHSGRREFRRDCRRYDELVAWGWTVFRFTWEQIMFEPDFVRWCLESWLRTRRGLAIHGAPGALRRLA